MRGEVSDIERQEETIDFFAICGILWKRKFLILAISGVSVAIAVAIAFTAKPIYYAEVSVTEVHDSNTGLASSLANQLGGLASFAGINLGSTSGVNHDAMAVLQSRNLVEEFIRRNNLLVELHHESKAPATLWRTVKDFRESVLSIKEDKRNGTTTVGISWTDAATAASWANAFVALANETLRKRALEDSKRNVDYLSEQIAQTKVVEVQRVMYNIIEAETKSLMLASGKTEYAFTIIDPAVAPEIRSSPKRTFIILIGGIMGGMIGVVAAIILNMTSRHQKLSAAR